MQRSSLKILGFILFLIPLQCAYTQTTSHRLKTADSLFAIKHYVQSLEHYQEILKQKQYTPAMLLKMAYVEEGLLHIGKSLYYLNLYFVATNDKMAPEKMNELAAKYNLQGYETTDADGFFSFYYQYHNFISAALAALMLLMLSFAVHTRTRHKRKPVVSFIFLVIFALALFANLYYGGRVTTAIVANGNTYIMDGPSAAAKVVDVISDGHRVSVIGEKDIWKKIQWNDQTGYIRQGSLLPVTLNN